MNNMTKHLLKNTLLFTLIVNLTLDFNFAVTNNSGCSFNQGQYKKCKQHSKQLKNKKKPGSNAKYPDFILELQKYLKNNKVWRKLEKSNIKQEIARLSKRMRLDSADKHPSKKSCMECTNQASLKTMKEYKKMILYFAKGFPITLEIQMIIYKTCMLKMCSRKKMILKKQAAGNKDIIFQSIENLKEKYKEEDITAVDSKKLPNMAKCVLLACFILDLDIDESYNFITQYSWYQIKQELHAGLEASKSFFEYFNNLLQNEAKIKKFFDDLVFHDEAMKLMQHASSPLDFEENKNKEKGTFIINDNGYSVWQQPAHINNNDPQKRKIKRNDHKRFQ